jgi:dihydropteroate synthase
VKSLAFRHVTFDWTRPYVMGVVNVTPDSFSDGGRYVGVDAAVAHAEALVAAGADMLDIGGEATNPKASPTGADEELRRVLPVIEAVTKRVQVPLSVDTTKAVVARAAIAAGAEVINDVSGGLFDPAMGAVVAELGAAYIVGHLRGGSIAEVFRAEAPVTLGEVIDELAQRLAALPEAARARVLVDPGLGFGKGADPAGNLDLLAHAGPLGAALGCPVVVGASRKRFLERLIAADRRGDTHAEAMLALDAATVGASLAAVAAGANIVRVHNVSLLRPALVAYWSTRVVS